MSNGKPGNGPDRISRQARTGAKPDSTLNDAPLSDTVPKVAADTEAKASVGAETKASVGAEANSGLDPMVRWSLVGVVLIVALAIAALPLFLRQTSESAENTDSVLTVSEEASASPVPVAARPDCPARGVAGVDLECLGGDQGQESARSDVAKEATVVNLWAWWCQPCREELPILERFAQEYPEFQVVGVHADSKAAAGADLLNELGVTMPSYQDSNNHFAAALELPAVVPITVVVHDGRVVSTLATPFHSVQELTEAVDAALAGAGGAR